MAQVSFLAASCAEQIGDASLNMVGKNQGTLKADAKEYSIFAFSDTEAVTEAVFKFLQEANNQESQPDKLFEFDFTEITQEMIEVESEIEALLQNLEKMPTPKESLSDYTLERMSPENLKLSKESNKSSNEQTKKEAEGTSSQGRTDVVYSSLFSLARSFHTSLSQTRQKQPAEQKNEKLASLGRQEARSTILPISTAHVERKMPQDNRYEREGNGKQEQRGSGQDQKQQKKETKQQNKRKKTVKVGSVQAARTQTNQGAQGGQSKSGNTSLGSIENVYIRFMALMARILGQAEMEAHQLYLRVKERTDGIDVLTLLLSKINSEKGPIDWTNNEEMKKLIEKARALGVDIAEGKLKWSEEEKKLLKENIQMRKDSMEKMTQLERTDMQRYLQEASQCHQARSNVLKLLKEVIDTIIHNMRPS